MLKKMIIATLLLGMTGLSLANTVQTTINDTYSEKIIPSANTSWALGIDGGNMKDPLEFRITGSYQFDDEHDILISNTYFNETDRNSLEYDFLSILTGSGYKYESKLNIINFEVGKKVIMWNLNKARYHLGLQHINLLNAVTESLFLNSTIKSSGFGPRIGLSIEHELTKKFGIYSETNVAWTRMKINDLSEGKSKNNINALSFDTHSGIYYDYAVPNGDLKLKLGWELITVNFFDSSNIDNYWGSFRAGITWKKK